MSRLFLHSHLLEKITSILEMEDQEDLANLVRTARKNKGLTQSEFAEELGRAQSLVSKYERGDVEPPGSVVMHCMNIVRPIQPPLSLTATATDVARLVDSRLSSSEYEGLRSALIRLIESVPASHAGNKP
jgi:transcriptional regulator with XRE-family HTH domain